jgi:hypothetical protein
VLDCVVLDSLPLKTLEQEQVLVALRVIVQRGHDDLVKIHGRHQG